MLLYDIFAEKWDRGGNIWVYSDPHFNDDEMKYIRYNYIGDEEQVKRINQKVGKNDTIIFLGDIGDVEFIKRIKGYKVLIMGNHDDKNPNYYKAFFDEVYDGPVMISDRVILSHEPMIVPPYIYNIHGHDHSKWFAQDTQHFNVCAEWIDYTPVGLKKYLQRNITVPHMHRYFIDKRNDEIKEREEAFEEVKSMPDIKFYIDNRTHKLVRFEKDVDEVSCIVKTFKTGVRYLVNKSDLSTADLSPKNNEKEVD